jgi:6-phosphogluconolactonase
MRALVAALLIGVLALAVFAIPSALATPAGPTTGPTAAVFILSNNATANQVIAYDRSSNGALTWVANYSAGGTGTGASLADQGSLVLSANHRWLFAVDAGSNQISTFQVSANGATPLLTLTNVVGSGGILPVSLAVNGHWVYVLNDGSPISRGNIAGFSLTSTGRLNPIAGSTQPLSTSNATGAAQISFNPAGTVLAVTEKATNTIDTYRVNSGGVAAGPKTHVSQGTTPYGFAFDPSGRLIGSEASSGSLSSYMVHAYGGLSAISKSVTDLQGAPCWVVVTGQGRFAYTSNGHSNSISSYTIGLTGRITLLQSVAAATGAGPNDMAIAVNHQLLYVYDAAAHDIEAFSIAGNGTLSWIQNTVGLPAGAEGLAVL